MTKLLTALAFLASVLCVAPALAAVQACLPNPLPVPTPPVFSRDIQRGVSDQMHFDVWRVPCAGGHALLLKVTPITQGPFVCYLDFDIVQGGAQFELFLADASTAGFCGNLLVTRTFSLVPKSSPAFNASGALTLLFDTVLGTPRFAGLEIPAAPVPPLPVTLAGAAILPGSRAVQVGHAATAFATMLASGPGTATGCTIVPTNAPAGTTFSYQQTNAANVPIGQPNTPATIPGGSGQSFVISLTPTAVFSATDIQFAFACANASAVAVLPGVNTLLLTSTSAPGPDIVALAATVTNDGIANIPPGLFGTGFFSVASVNVGVGAQITASVDTGSVSLPIAPALCQTNPATGACLDPTVLSTSATVQIDAGQTPTFAVFVVGTGNVAFNPGVNRVFVRFKTAAGATVGATSVAVRTQ